MNVIASSSFTFTLGSFSFRDGSSSLGFFSFSKSLLGCILVLLILIFVHIEFLISFHELLELADAITAIIAQECAGQIDIVLLEEIKRDFREARIVLPLVLILLQVSSGNGINVVSLGLGGLALVLGHSLPFGEGLNTSTLVVNASLFGAVIKLLHKLRRGSLGRLVASAVFLNVSLKS